MARNRGRIQETMMPAMPEMPMKLDAECIPCLENNGMWYFAQHVRVGDHVSTYDVEMALRPDEYQRFRNNQTVLQPIRNAAGTNSVQAMISEGCPPNTGRHYEKV